MTLLHMTLGLVLSPADVDTALRLFGQVYTDRDELTRSAIF